jgi:hypothetical protein
MHAEMNAGVRRAIKDRQKKKTTVRLKADGGSNSSSWWTRTQRIGTVSRVAVSVALLETKAPALYQRIAEKAAHLRELGLSFAATARCLEVDDKTVAKAVWWFLRRRGDVRR